MRATGSTPTRWLVYLVGVIAALTVLALGGQAWASSLPGPGEPVGAVLWLLLIAVVVLTLAIVVLAALLVIVWRSVLRLDAELAKARVDWADLRASSVDTHALDRLDDRLRADLVQRYTVLDERLLDVGERLGGVETTMGTVLGEVRQVAAMLGGRPA